MKKVYEKRVFTKRVKDLIPGTGFSGGITEKDKKYISKKNTTPNDVIPYVFCTLNYKTGYGISTSQEGAKNIFAIKSKKFNEQYFVGLFDGGSKNDVEFFVMNADMQLLAASNIYSHLLIQMIIAVERYLHPGEEADLMFRQINFNTSTGVIDVDQKRQFLVLNDNINQTMLSNIVGREIDEDSGKDFLYSKYLKPLENDDFENISAFVLNGKRKNTTLTKNFFSGNDALYGKIIEKMTSAEVVKPNEEIEVPKTFKEILAEKRQARLKKYHDEYYHGLHPFTQEEIQAMPALLQAGYVKAQQMFKEYRDTFGEMEWDIIDGIAQGHIKSIKLAGPAGTGKTTILTAIAGCLGLPHVLVGGSGNKEETNLIGKDGIVSENGNTNTVFIEGALTMAVRYGAFFQFDEINTVSPGVLEILNPLLDDNGQINIESVEKTDVIKAHKNFVFAATMNPGYEGTTALNLSLIDRITESYHVALKPVAEEAKIIQKKIGYDNLDNIKKAVTIKNYIQKQIELCGNPSEQHTSPRRVIAWLNKASRTGEFIESALSTILDPLITQDEEIGNTSLEDINLSNGIVANALSEISETFEEVSY